MKTLFLPCALVLWTLLAACSSGLTPNTGAPDGQLPNLWTYELAGTAQGVAVHPTSGDVYLSVDAHDSAAFADGGGVVVFDAEGRKLADVPMVLPKACDACTRLSFSPQAPLVAAGATHVYLGDEHLNLFRFATHDFTIDNIIVDSNGIYTALTGIDHGTALAPDGERAFLAGGSLYVLALTGTVEQELNFGGYLQEIRRVDHDRYLLNLTGAYDSEGTLALWDTATGTFATYSLPAPIRGIATTADLTVAVVETGLATYQLIELDLATNPPVTTELSTFEMSGSGYSLFQLAVRPGTRQVAIGAPGTAVADDGEITVLVGSTLFIDAATGAVARADTSSVLGLAFSPDGNTLYVADTGGLKAFALPGAGER